MTQVAAADLAELTERVAQRLEALAEARAVERIWAHDHTLWSNDPTEITEPNRLGWLDVAEAILPETPALRAFAEEAAADGFTDAVLMGMGGSSLAPEMFASVYGTAPGALNLHVLDTTVPAEIISLERALDLSKTLFIVASKSGTTVETSSHLAYFWEKRPHGRQFIAITDADTHLDRLGQEREFRRVFNARDSLGGRYSALSHFGVVPAALIGLELPPLLESAIAMAGACREPAPADNPGAWLGAVIGEASLAGHDKLTFALPPAFTSLGYWLEQLIAESTGKQGRGIIPIEGEPPGPSGVYGDDRIFAALGDATEPAASPSVRLPFTDAGALGGELFRWEFAAAIAGHVLAINPFDQPNVQQAKDATARALQGDAPSPPEGRLDDLLRRVRPGDYICIQAYLPRTDAVRATLAKARRALRDRYRVATTVGFGPRYLHSTGQIHKGGPNTGVFIQLVDEPGADISVPATGYTFGRLMRAQADGDHEALRDAGRRVTRVRFEEIEALR
jgi:glucose-6-phosphate isomerase